VNSLKLVVGCPVSRREWILGRWFDHVDRAATVAEVEVSYVFVVAEEDPCVQIMDLRGDCRKVFALDSRSQDKRDWSPDRYQVMTDLRNMLLREVRTLSVPFFLSLDSDILLHQDAVCNLLESIQVKPHFFDAVGGKCYMTSTGVKYPSFAQLTSSGGLLRSDEWSVFPVDVLMAIKLMSPAAYAVDYVYDQRGEDLGWSKACRKAGLKLGFDGRVVSKHVMNHDYVDVVDKRVGF
jgi:hypothetical protein